MKHHVLSIGVSKHQNSDRNLTFAAKDASDFFNLLTSNVGNFGYQKLITDNEATMAQIRSALGSELLREIKPEDAFFFFYSGHGATAEDPTSNDLAHFLVPFDATTDITNSAISVSYLKDVFSKIKCESKLIFIDSCFSGSINSKCFAKAKKKASAKLKTVANTVVGDGNVSFSACKEDETALEDPELKNSVFTYFLIEELQKSRDGVQFPALDIVTPVTEKVIERAKKWKENQTPTFNGSLRGSLFLPTFKTRLNIKPQTIEIPKYPQLADAPIPQVQLQLSDKEQEKLLNETIAFVVDGHQSPRPQLQEIVFQRFCLKVVKAVKADWERIFTENGNSIEHIPASVAKLEAASHHLILLGGVLTVFGTKKQMEVYSESVCDLFELTRNRSGLTALIAVPEMIFVETIYVVAILSVARRNFDQLDVLLNSMVYAVPEWEPKSLIHHYYVHFCDALGGSANKVNDHVRSVLKNFPWLTELAPVIDGKVDDFQLQANLLLTMLYNHADEKMWPDFARFYKHRVINFVRRLNYDLNFRKGLANLFRVKEGEVRSLVIKLFEQIQKTRLGDYWWESVTAEDFLTVEEKKHRESQKINGPA